MLDGLVDEEVDHYLEENPKIVPLFEVDVAKVVMPYVTNREEEVDEPDREAIRELQQPQEVLEREMVMSLWVKVSILEEIDVGTSKAPRLVNMATEMPPDEKTTMIELLKEFKDVFAWSYGDMRGLDPKLCYEYVPPIGGADWSGQEPTIEVIESRQHIIQVDDKAD